MVVVHCLIHRSLSFMYVCVCVCWLVRKRIFFLFAWVCVVHICSVGFVCLKHCRSGIYLHCWHSTKHTKRIKKPIYSNDKEKQWAHDETPHVLFFFSLSAVLFLSLFLSHTLFHSNEMPSPLREKQPHEILFAILFKTLYER